MAQRSTDETRKSFSGINEKVGQSFPDNDEYIKRNRRSLLQPIKSSHEKQRHKEKEFSHIESTGERSSSRISQALKDDSSKEVHVLRRLPTNELFSSHRDVYSHFKNIKSRTGDKQVTKSPRHKKMLAKWSPSELSETDFASEKDHIYIADRKVQEATDSEESDSKLRSRETGLKKTQVSKKPISPLNDSGYYSSSPRSRKSPNEFLQEVFAKEREVKRNTSKQAESNTKLKGKLSVIDDLKDQVRNLFRTGNKQTFDSFTHNLESVLPLEQPHIRNTLENIVHSENRKLVFSKSFSVTLTSDQKDGSYIFIVMSGEHTLTNADQSWIKYMKRKHIKMESEEIISHEMKKSLSEKKVEELGRFIKDNLQISYVKDLFKGHSNLNMISLSKVKSLNYGSPDWNVTDELCVVMYCFHKGYIPFGEHPFPRRIGYLRTDVREGYCEFSTKTKVQMGRSVYTESTQMASSLGNFVQSEDGSIAFITCAHALFPMSELKTILSFEEYRRCEFYDSETREKIGQVADVYFEYNIPDSVDAALVKLNKNTDIVPGFPTILMDQLQHAGFLFQPFDISSKTLEVDYINKKCYVVKYGAETQFTIGILELGIVSARFNWNFKENLAFTSNTCDSDDRFVMFNQILINPVDKQPFLQQGDSGSFVFMVDDQEKTLKCIGMLIGQTSSGQGIMTPIHRILKKLNIKGLKSFGQPVKLQTTFSNPMMEMLSKMQSSMNQMQSSMDQMNLSMKSVNDKVDNLDRRVYTLECESVKSKTEQMDLS